MVSPESAPDSSQTVEYSSLLQNEEIGDAAQAAISLPQGLPAEETPSDPAALLWFVMMLALGIVGWVFLHKMIRWFRKQDEESIPEEPMAAKAEERRSVREAREKLLQLMEKESEEFKASPAYDELKEEERKRDDPPPLKGKNTVTKASSARSSISPGTQSSLPSYRPSLRDRYPHTRRGGCQ